MSITPQRPAAVTAPFVQITLRPWEYALVAQVGAQRAARNHGRPDAPHYDRSRMEDDRTAQHAAAACECAVARALNLYWTAGGAWDMGQHDEWKPLADVGHNIEVRRVREPNASTFAMGERDRDRIIAVAYAEPPELQVVRAFGWIDGATAYEAGSPAVKYPTRRRVPLSVLTLDRVHGKVQTSA